jgi:hypothetical protein
VWRCGTRAVARLRSGWMGLQVAYLTSVLRMSAEPSVTPSRDVTRSVHCLKARICISLQQLVQCSVRRRFVQCHQPLLSGNTPLNVERSASRQSVRSTLVICLQRRWSSHKWRIVGAR